MPVKVVKVNFIGAGTKYEREQVRGSGVFALSGDVFMMFYYYYLCFKCSLGQRGGRAELISGVCRWLSHRRRIQH